MPDPAASPPPFSTPRPRPPRAWSWREFWTRRLADLVLRAPWTILAISAALAIGGAVLAWRGLGLDADTNSLIAPDRPFMKLYRAFLEEFGDLEYLYVVVDSRPSGGEDPDDRGRRAAESAVDELIEGLRSIPSLPAVHGRIEPSEQLRLATRAMEIDRLEALATASGGVGDLASGDATTAIRGASERLATLLSRGLALDDRARRTLAAEAILVLDVVASAEGTGGAEPSLAEPPDPQYLRSDTGRIYFVAVMPAKDFGRLEAIAEPLAAIRKVIAEVAARHPEVEIGLTGKPVLQADELSTTNEDMRLATGISFSIVAGLFVVVFRGLRRPLLAIIAFAMAFAWTCGVAALLVGHLNLLSIVFTLVLVGVGLDYGVHVVARFMEARRRRLASGAIRDVMRTAVPGNVTGSLTSAAAFLLALTTTFEGLRELGVIAGSGLLLCALAMCVVLPALLWLTERRGRRSAREPLPPPSAVVETVARRRPPARAPDVLLLAAVGLVTLAGIVLAARSLRFETNLLELQAEGLPSVEWEHRVFDDSVSASWFGAIVVPDLAGAARVVVAAKDHPEIGRTASILDLIRPEDDRRIAARARIRSAIEQAPAASVASDRWTPAELSTAADRLALLARAAASQAPEESRRLLATSERLRRLIDRLGKTGADADADDAHDARAAIDAAIESASSNLRLMAEGDGTRLREALPAALRDQMMAPSGRFLVRLMPSGDAWSLEPLERFVEAIRSIDPQATGVPMTQLESIRDMTRAFMQMAILAFLAVAILVWLDFRSVLATLVCLCTLVVGLGWTLGAMAASGTSLNLANFFAVPILMGLGIDSSVHLVHRAREQRGGRIRYGATAKAVVLTAATTAIGFGALVFASHRGLQTLGMVMLVGSIACLGAAMLVVPSLLRLAGWERRRAAPGEGRAP